MVTNTKKKVVKKKATVVTNTNDKVAFTRKQVETIANFYTKNGKKLPAFLAKKVAM